MRGDDLCVLCKRIYKRNKPLDVTTAVRLKLLFVDAEPVDESEAVSNEPLPPVNKSRLDCDCESASAVDIDNELVEATSSNAASSNALLLLLLLFV